MRFLDRDVISDRSFSVGFKVASICDFDSRANILGLIWVAFDLS